MNVPDEDVKIVTKHVEQLMEHFDTVQIFVTAHRPAEVDGTVTLNLGGGSWCARHGQIVEWVEYQKGRIRAHAAKQINNDS